MPNVGRIYSMGMFHEQNNVYLIHNTHYIDALYWLLIQAACIHTIHFYIFLLQSVD